MYVPFRCETESDILGNCLSYVDRYNDLKSQIEVDWMKFCFWRNEVVIALKEFAEEPELTERSAATHVARNILSMGDHDICYCLRNITHSIDLDGSWFLCMPSFDSHGQYYEMIALLNERQEKFLLEVLFGEANRCFCNSDCESSSLLFLAGCAGTWKSLLITLVLLVTPTISLVYKKHTEWNGCTFRNYS